MLRRVHRIRSIGLAIALATFLMAPAQEQAQEIKSETVAATTEAPGKVTIIRDNWGMAHLYAARETDGFYGLGYAIAQDRLEQVLLLYLAVQGELAAKFGPGPVGADKVSANLASIIPDTVASDMQVRQYRMLDYARRNLDLMPSQYRRDLEAYIAGINRYMADHPEKQPAWAPKLEPAMPLAEFYLLGEAASVCPPRIGAEAAPQPPAGAKGSNAWVVGSSRTADGGTILSSDSHGPWNVMGGLFYQWRMKAGGMDFQSVEPTGTVMFFFGHSANFAWAWTEAPRYPADCYKIRTEPGDPTAYRVDGKLKKMIVTPYKIEVRGAAPVTGTFEYANYNGILSPVVARAGSVAYAVSFSQEQDVGLENAELYRMARARTYAELKHALAAMQLYPANLLVAGRDGTLLYIRPGKLPKRAAGLDLTKPLDGNTARTAWTGFTSFDESVHLERPRQDYIANDNTSPDTMYPGPVLKASDYPQSAAFDPGQITSRQVRNIELLDNAHGLTDQAAIGITMDEKIPGFEHWAAAFDAVKGQSLWPNSDNDLQTFLSGLRAFDGTMARDSASALYFSAFFQALQKTDAASAHDIMLAITSGASLTDQQEQQIARAALEACKGLKAAFGRINLTYGDVHRLTRGRKSWPVGGGAFYIGGDNLELDQDGARVPQPTVLSPLRTMLFIPDPKDPRLLDWFCCERAPFVVAFHPGRSPTSYSQLLPGISNDPSSPHYDDQLELASEGVMRPDDFDLRDLLQDAESSAVLEVK